MDLIEEIICLIETKYATQLENGKMTLLVPTYNCDTDKYVKICIGVDLNRNDCGECIK